MTGLKRLVLDLRTDELVVRCLYRSQDEAGPNTKARRRDGYGAHPRRPQRRPGGLRGACGCCRRKRIYSKGGRSFGHSLTRCRQASEGSLVDIARSEAVDAELDRLISKRASQNRRPDEDEQEELWKESVRAYTARRREEMRTAWHEYHQGQAARHRGVLESLIARHEEEAAKLMDIEPKGAA
jgi:hypothetical protein